ncbi:hypothetical protein BGZ72_007109 [Mortierella alpina]|nr:hypothetical protein BGZ72_007109 [Mortierella alpina]
MAAATSAAADPHCNRIVTHWARTTPEEGIQLHLRCADVQRTGDADFQIQTDPPSTDRICQWNITLRPVYKAASTSPHTSVGAPALKPAAQSRGNSAEPEQSGSRSRVASEPAVQSSPSTLLILTLERLVPHDTGVGTERALESPTCAGRVRCEAYRTLYIYSPKLKRDICVHPIKKQPWPQTGSNPRQEDTRTAAIFSHMQQLLRAMRKDSATADVEIVIKDSSYQDPGHLETAERLQGRHKTGPAKGNKGKDSAHYVWNSGVCSSAQGETYWRCDNRLRSRKTCFKAHKCVLETIPFFSRMLNGGFREGFTSPRGVHRIELSNDMFDAGIMDYLLDYLYTHELDVELDASPQENTRPRAQSLGHGSDTPAPAARVHHIISANVGLNLQTVVSESRASSPRAYSQSAQERQSTQASVEVSKLTLRQWGALYRAAVHLEDKALQALSLETIEARLDPDTTLDQVLNWGQQHEEIKAIMVRYLVKKRRCVFGEEQTNRLRPYLWAEYEDQVDTLVEITSLIARQPE